MLFLCFAVIILINDCDLITNGIIKIYVLHVFFLVGIINEVLSIVSYFFSQPGMGD